MDIKRRTNNMLVSSTSSLDLPWPVLQRRTITKFKEDRLEEFERACNHNLEWLENYYQGCVYAALQNKAFAEQRSLNLSANRY